MSPLALCFSLSLSLSAGEEKSKINPPAIIFGGCSSIVLAAAFPSLLIASLPFSLPPFPTLSPFPFPLPSFVLVLFASSI